MSKPAPDTKSQGLSVRVVVRIRPVTNNDSSTSCSTMHMDPDGQHVNLTPPDASRAGHKYAFNAVLPEAAPQEDVYRAAGVQQLVLAAAAGYHATVFAYGQTGSGKTFTMEGFRYTVPVVGPKQKPQAPAVDFANTPPQQLGITPRAVQALFAALSSNAERRFSVRCSYVQIYKEQAYDLLNPTSIMLTPGGQQAPPPQQPQQLQQPQMNGKPNGNQGLPGALRMRWSKADDFYLENLFKVECGSADEALSLFRSGVSNKIMASHKLNAQSSRSHCLFTLYIDSSPLASPNEVISSRLTLVDLAGSERGSTVGATEGKLRDESVAINKSLFTLRHVITCLAANCSKEQAGGAAPGAVPKLPPYRDSKLTSLLKNSLGGSAMTLMLACVAPVDTYYEENVSTLEYARQAARITNQVSVNEDPKTKLIRELRAEVAFLRQQLAAVQSPGAVTASLLGPAAGDPPAALGSTAGQQQQQRPSQKAAGPAGGAGPGPAAARSSPQPVQAPGQPQQSVEELRHRLLESTQHDIGIMVSKLLDAISLVQSLSAVNQQMRVAYDQVSKHSEELRIENDNLMIENAAVRDRLSFIEGVAGMSTSRGGSASGGGGEGGGAGGPGGAPPAVFTASTAALLELQELRRENALLHERLKGRGGAAAAVAPSGGGGPGGQTARFSKQRGPPGGGANSGGGNGGYPGSPSRAAPAAAVTPFTPAVLRQVLSPNQPAPSPLSPSMPPTQVVQPGRPPNVNSHPRRASDPLKGGTTLNRNSNSNPALGHLQGGSGSSPQLPAAATERFAKNSPPGGGSSPALGPHTSRPPRVSIPLNLSSGAVMTPQPASPHVLARSLSVEGGLGAAGGGGGRGLGPGCVH